MSRTSRLFFMRKFFDFFKRHLILTNVLLMGVATLVIVALINVFLGWWTGHGDVRTVPAVKNMTLANATGILAGCDLEVEVADSVYSEAYRPGAVTEQFPEAGSTVKPGRTVYLTLNATTPPQIPVPNLVGISLRQAQAALRSLGFTDIREVRVPSDYKDLVIAVKSMGVSLRAGTKLPASATIVIEVGEGPVVEDESAVTDSLFIENPELIYD